MYNRLSNRMLALTDLLDAGLSVADIGCDHAFVAIHLIKENLAEKVIAMDIGKGPLEIAKQNIAAAGLSEKIETRLSDGAKELSVGEVQAAVIAGMGGMLMEKILKASSEVFRAMKELVLQPQSDLPHFRRFLYENGYEIVDENMIFEEGKFYPMMKVIPNDTLGTEAGYQNEKLISEAENRDDICGVMLTYGPVLLKSKNQVLKEFLNREKAQKEAVLAKLEISADSERARERIEALKYEIRLNELACRIIEIY